MPADQLTSFSKKKSFEVHHDSDQEQLMNDEDFLALEKQISQQQPPQQQLDQYAQEETKSRRSERESMKGVSFATSDTEEQPSEHDQPQVDKPLNVKKRLSRVEEELKHMENTIQRDTLSEQNPINRSNATSMRGGKQAKATDQSKQSAQTSKKKKKDETNTQQQHKSTHDSRRQTKSHIAEQSIHSQQPNVAQIPMEQLLAAQAQLMQQNPWMQMMMMPPNGLMGYPAQYPQNILQMQQQQQLRMSQQQQMAQLMTPSGLNPLLMSSMYNSNYQSQPGQNPYFSQQSQIQKQPQPQNDPIQHLKLLRDQGQLPSHLRDVLAEQEQLQQLIEQIQTENNTLEQEIQRNTDLSVNIVSESLNQQIELRRQQIQDQKTTEAENDDKVVKQTAVNDDQNGSKLAEAESDPHFKIEHSEDTEQKEQASVNINDDDKAQVDQALDKIDEQPKQTEESEKAVQEPLTEQDLVLKEIALMAARGHDPTAELEKENDELTSFLEELRMRERDLVHCLSSLEYENEILFGKSNSMDHSIQKYGKRLEELSKQIDELNAILRIKDQEMIEMTNDIHTLRMIKEAMRKEILFRKQREEHLQLNLRKVTNDLEKAQFEADDISRTNGQDSKESNRCRDENKRLKASLDMLRQELAEDQRHQEEMNQRMNEVNITIDECESRVFTTKNQIDRLRNEQEQFKVDISYAKATTENQKEAYEKLHQYYQKQVNINAQLDSQQTLFSIQPRMEPPSASHTNRFSMLPEPSQPLIDLDSSYQQHQNQEDRRVHFQLDHHKRSSSQDRNQVQAKNFKRPTDDSTKDQISAHNSSRIKTILFDLSNPEPAEASSITGQKRRGGVTSLTREGNVSNRNFVHQMSNILAWQEKDTYRSSANTFEPTKSLKTQQQTVPRQNQRPAGDLSMRNEGGRLSTAAADTSIDTSLRFGRQNLTLNQSYQQQGNDTEAIQQQELEYFRNLKKDPAKINSMKDELNSFQQRREKINAEINKISDRTRDGSQKRNTLDEEMKGISKRIGEIKMHLRKIDALKNAIT